MSNHKTTYQVIMLGPPPGAALGGISEVVPAYKEVLNLLCVPHCHVVINDPSRFGGRLFLWITRYPSLVQKIMDARKTGQRTILYSHPGAGFSIFRAGALSLLGRVIGANTVLHLHAGEVALYLEKTWQKQLFKLGLIGVQQLLVLTPWWKRLLEKHGISLPIDIVPNPISQEFIQEGFKSLENRRKFNSSSNQISILIMTRLARGKGIKTTLAAMALLPDNFSLVIAGTGRLKKELDRYIDQLGIRSRVQFTGWVTGTEKTHLLEKSDIYCMPSSIDSFGMGFIEAMAFGLPVIALRWGPVPDIVPHAEVGILLDTKSCRSVAEAILALESPQERFTLGQQGHKWVTENFSVEIISEKLRNTFTSILK